MDQLKCLSIPSEMLRFSNHASHPRLGHPTKSVHSTPHDIHSIRRMNVAQCKCQIPWKVSALCPPRTYSTSNVWTWPKASAKDPGRSVHSAPTNIHNMHMPIHFQHQSTFHLHVIHNINVISSQWRYQQQQQPHFRFTYSSIITIHVDMVFINNAISN